ncbi:MAG: ATPase [Ardenticatenia bacterium]|jgi:rhamnose transport system permease protein|nr:MAG: ATPase [Ardenticatenia bacterium]
MVRSATLPLQRFLNWLKSWEGLLLGLLIVILIINSALVPAYLSVSNQVNLFILFIEKSIVALMIAFIIINGEIDLSMASLMGLSAGTMARLYELGVPSGLAVLAALCVGLICGAFNGFWVAVVGLPSLVVTLAGLIAYRGMVWVLVEDRSISVLPAWLNDLGQKPLIGPFPFALLLFFAFVIIGYIILQYSGFGRLVYVIGINQDVARYSGVNVRRVKMILFTASGFVSSIAGLLYAARLGAMRSSTAEGFELDIITMVLLGGVSIFGGSGTLRGVFLSILIILNVRNGMGLAYMSANLQTGVIGLLLILSVLVPNLINGLRARMARRREMVRSLEMAESS